MLDDILAGEFHILHVRAVHDQVVKLGVKVGVEGLGGIGAGMGGADDIGIVLFMVLLQIGKLGHPGVHGLVVAPPLEKPVTEGAKGIRPEIKAHDQQDQQQHRTGKGQEPAL